MPLDFGPVNRKKKLPPLQRIERPQRDTPASRIVAYDLETTRIQKGTPAPLYVTAYGEFPEMSLRRPVRSILGLYEILVEEFLIDARKGVRYVAWNANHFDAYFIAAALLQTDQFVMRPYLTRGKALRGMRVFRRVDFCEDDKAMRGVSSWEFLDGIAMTGLQGFSLDRFTKMFSPNVTKMTGVIDFEKEEFNSTNAEHCEYAFQDSVSLYYSLRAAEDILLSTFNRALGTTMGGACIKIFKSYIPERKVIYCAPESLNEIIFDQVMRGGYCYCARKYDGPIWKYDLNQAYASAMRDARLPAGGAIHGGANLNPYCDVFIVRITATNRSNKIPFYCKTNFGRRSEAFFATTEIPDTWITSIEYEQLQREGWNIEILDSYFFDDSFSMSDYVNVLEHLRSSFDGGPGGAGGTMIKAVGNHSYGKTVERLEPQELILSKECPAGFTEFIPDEPESVLSHVWTRFKDRETKDYHKPQIGCFITAHVRMVVRRAALINPDSWLYADTDCVAFDSDVTSSLDIHKTRYGAWKVEAAGEHYRIITKKVYAEREFDVNDKKAVRHAKGLNVKKLTSHDFELWYDGKPPEQIQIQRQNIVKVLQGSEMFIERKRKGTKI